MWDTAETSTVRLSHDPPCPSCGHAAHTYLPCSDTCACARTGMPGAVALTPARTPARTTGTPAPYGSWHRTSRRNP